MLTHGQMKQRGVVGFGECNPSGACEKIRSRQLCRSLLFPGFRTSQNSSSFVWGGSERGVVKKGVNIPGVKRRWCKVSRATNETSASSGASSLGDPHVNHARRPA